MSALSNLVGATSLLAIVGCQSVPTLDYTPSPEVAEEASRPILRIHKHNSPRINAYEQIATAHKDINTFSQRTGRNPTEMLLRHYGDNAHELLRTYTYPQALGELTGRFNPHFTVKDDPAFVHFTREDQQKVIVADNTKEHIGPKLSFSVEKLGSGATYTIPGNPLQRKSNQRNMYNTLAAQNLSGEASPTNLMNTINEFEVQRCDARSGEMGILTGFNKTSGKFSAHCSTTIPRDIPSGQVGLNLCEGLAGNAFLKCASRSTGQTESQLKTHANKCYTDGRRLGYQQGFSLTLEIQKGKVPFIGKTPPDTVIPTCTLVR